MRHKILFITLMCALLIACRQQQRTQPANPNIVRGDVINPEESGSVTIQSNGLFCSGTLLTNDWAITAQHCGLDIANPGNINVGMGSQSSVGAFAVGHPSLDFALVRVATPFRMNGSPVGFRMPLYTGTTASLIGQTLTCRGYGCNNSTDEDCTGLGDTLREALLKTTGFFDDYNFNLAKNARGQVLAPGDSGTGCFATTSSGLGLAYIHKGGSSNESFGGRPENWRDWALAYVNGTPIPLPDHWSIGSSHPEFLTRPLPNSYIDSSTWNPCPGGQEYSFTPTFDLESGQDFISLSSSTGNVSLTGSGMTTCTGHGPITASIKTSGSNQSIGLLSMPITCNFAGPPSAPPTTNVSPVVAGVGNNVYFFAKTSDSRIMYNRAILGQGGLCWSQVDGNGLTNNSPAAGAVGDHVFVAVRGLDTRVWINQGDLGHPFGNWSPTDFRTDAAPAVTGVGGAIYFFAKGREGRIFYDWAILGQGGHGWVEMDGNGLTDTGPAAGAIGSHIFVAVKGLDGRVWVNQGDQGHPFGQWFPTDFTTNVAPAVAGVGNAVYFFAKGLDGRIFYDWAVLGQGGHGWKEVEGAGRTDVAPSAGAVGTHVFVAIKSLDGRILVNQADLGGAFGDWF